MFNLKKQKKIMGLFGFGMTKKKGGKIRLGNIQRDIDQIKRDIANCK